jgi:hypothetical protein
MKQTLASKAKHRFIAEKLNTADRPPLNFTQAVKDELSHVDLDQCYPILNDGLKEFSGKWTRSWRMNVKRPRSQGQACSDGCRMGVYAKMSNFKDHLLV